MNTKTNFIYRDLDLPHLKEFFILKNEYDSFPEVITKLITFMTKVNNSKYLGLIDVFDTPINYIEDTPILTTLPQKNYADCKLSEHLLFLVLWDDRIWGKLESVNNLIKYDLWSDNFSLNNFREMIGLTRGKNETPLGRTFGSFLLKKMISHNGFGSHIPAITRIPANYYNGFFYGHSGGYARQYTYFDLSIRKKISKVIKNLSDDSSKLAFRCALLGKPEEVWKYYFNKIKSPPQYLDYIKLDSDSVIINCGVEGGSEIPTFLSYGAQIYNIDPDGKSKLHKYTQSWADLYQEKLTFIDKWLYTSPINTDQVPATLKSIINELNIERIDLVKTDIEGAERYMINDLVEIAEKYRPQIAISIYHTQYDNKETSPLSDLVDMPLELMNQLKNYSFHVGFYSFERWEIILYCIPN